MDHQQQNFGAPPPVQHQPAPAAGMTMGPYTAQQREKFSTELCGCGVPDFCMACCCSCIVYGKNQQRLTALSNGQALRPEQVEPCGVNTLIFLGIQYITGCGGIVMECLQRSKIRAHYGIPGSEGSDCFMACCCTPCALLQEERELVAEGDTLLGSGGGHTEKQY